MRKVQTLCCALLILTGLAWLGSKNFNKNLTLHKTFSAPAKSEQASETISVPASDQSVTYQTYDLSQATVHVVTVPAGIPISVAVADELITARAVAHSKNALAVLNGGFFDPQNGKTTSHLTVQGQPAGSPVDNERLTGNPTLETYLDQIFNRSELRAYRCEPPASLRYDITLHSTPLPNGCELESALGAGPQLLPENTATAEAFTDYENGELVRDAIGSVQPNARSAIALQPDGTVRLFMVAQRPDAPGMLLSELSGFAASLGVTQLLNLDGGSSSSLYYSGQTYLGRLDANGNRVERPVKSVIVVGQPPSQ